MLLLANLRGKLSWLLMSLRNGTLSFENALFCDLICSLIVGWLAWFVTCLVYEEHIFRSCTKFLFIYFFHDTWDLIGSFCSDSSGLTSSNYSELTHIYEKYKTQGKLNFCEESILIFGFLVPATWLFWKEVLLL